MANSSRTMKVKPLFGNFKRVLANDQSMANVGVNKPEYRAMMSKDRLSIACQENSSYFSVKTAN